MANIFSVGKLLFQELEKIFYQVSNLLALLKIFELDGKYISKLKTVRY